MKICESIKDLIGNTPIIRLKNIEKELNLSCELYAKVEFLNPGGSIKDRVALKMIEEAEKQGLINNDTTIIEPTSGNTGIGLCVVCADKGYKTIIVMPDTMSKERIMLMEAYGATVVLTNGKLGMKGAVDKANELSKFLGNTFIPSQFENEANVKAHYETTAKEIYEQMENGIDVFVAGIGTGGTITGVGKYLKEKTSCKIIGVEPETSPLISKGYSGSHKIQGIGANFIPSILDKSVIDGIVRITDDEAYKAGKYLAIKQGLLVGISSGANLSAALKLTEIKEYQNKKILIILADTGDRYLSVENYLNTNN